MFILFLLYLSFASIPVSFFPATKTPPSSRMYHMIDYIHSYNSLLVFGGLSGSSRLNDIFYFNLDTQAWGELIPFTLAGPGKLYLGARQGPGGFVSETLQYLFVYGGASDIGPLNDLWGFSASSQRWFEFNTISPPTPRTLFGFVHYIEAGVEYFAVFGGMTLYGRDNGLYV
jgi:hypothetical protein